MSMGEIDVLCDQFAYMARVGDYERTSLWKIAAHWNGAAGYKCISYHAVGAYISVLTVLCLARSAMT